MLWKKSPQCRARNKDAKDKEKVVAKINVQNTEITVISIDERDYISLTDMVKNIENGLAFIEK